MDLKLQNKTALITGSTSGIGFGTAHSLAKEGVSVILNGRKAEGVQAAIKKLQSMVPDAKISGVATDFSAPETIDAFLKQIDSVDILINNVGIFSAQSFFETTDEDWHQQIEVNVMSGVRLSRHFLPKMIEKKWGRILFISSECATLVPADIIAYSTTKAALHAISRGLSHLTSGTNVTVNTIVPGSTLTEGADNFLRTVAEKENKTKEQVAKDFFTKVRTTSLLKRFATVEEIASTITYYASPLSAATNGAVIKIDGGSMGGIV